MAARLAEETGTAAALRGGGTSRGGGGWQGGHGSWRGGDWNGGHGSGWHGDHHGWHGHGGADIYFGVGPWWPYWSYPYGYAYPYPYYPYPSYAYPAYPDDNPDEDQVYVEPPSESRPQSGERPEGYWYYCASKHGYYPRIAECPEEWIKVPPTGSDR